MTQDNGFEGEVTDFRKQVEKRLREGFPAPEEVSNLTQEEVERLVHELQVHQIELEVQNEELRRIQNSLEALKDKYVDLYDFAPVGYLTLSDQGAVLECNLAAARMLGDERSRLLKSPFSRMIHRADSDLCYVHLQRVIETQEKQTCEIRLERKDGSTFHAQMDSTALLEAEAESTGVRAIISDITDRKNAEMALLKSEARYRALFDEALDAILIVETGGEIVAANQLRTLS